MKYVIPITALFMITALAPAKEVKTGALTLNVPALYVRLVVAFCFSPMGEIF